MRKILSLLAVASLLMLSGCAPTIGTVLRQSRFSELRPPTTLVPPGTIIQVLDKDPTFVNIVCDRGDALGDPKLHESTSENVRLVAESEGTLKLSGDYLEQLRANSEFKWIRSVSLTLSNVRVYEITDSTFFSSVRNATEGCRQAVKFRISQKQPIALVKSVMQADVRYSIIFDTATTLDAEARRNLVKNLAMKLNADVTTVTENTVDGQALYWGIRTDGKLARLITPDTVSADPSRLERLARAMGRVMNPVRATVTVVKPK